MQILQENTTLDSEHVWDVGFNVCEKTNTYFHLGENIYLLFFSSSPFIDWS